MTLEALAISRGIIESPTSNHPLVERLRTNLASRGTDGSGFSDLQRRFNVLDRDGSKTLNMEEFKVAFFRSNLNFNDQEIATLFYFFDSYEKSYIDYDEFMLGVRGPVSPKRRELIEKAWQQIDINGEGVVTPEEVIDRFDPTQHPDVKNGIKKAQDVFRDFMRAFEVGSDIENKVTRSEFENYYFNVSASIDRDEYFEIMIRNAWHFSGLETWSTSSSNPRRTIGFRPDGTEYIDENGPRSVEMLAQERSARYGPASTYRGDMDGPRSQYRDGPRGQSRERSLSPSRGRSSSPPPAAFMAGRTDRPLNF